MAASTSNSTSTSIVIGAGFAGIAAATALAAQGHRVTVVERHTMAGGRARVFEAEGFVFDMGPSWYWMPDVFEAYFKRFGSDVRKELDLVRLDPSYRVWFEDGPMDIPAGVDALAEVFEKLEQGAGQRLKDFMEEARTKYEIGMGRFVQKPAHSVLEFADFATLRDATRLTLFRSFSRHARSYFSHPKILSIIEFPVLFLGAAPERTPALYSLMNYADTALGTWYPQGGMHRIVEAMVRVARAHGVEFRFSADVAEVHESGGRVAGVRLKDGSLLEASTVIAAADYHHVEQHLLPARWRRYSAKYWESRTMSPSSLLFYLGLDCKVPELEHHNLFFDTPFGPHAETIYTTKTWPDNPLFYVSAPSRTDPTVAPAHGENLFLLIPLAPGLTEQEDTRQRYLEVMLERIRKHTGRDLAPHIVYQRSYAHRDFEADYRAFKGNAYGLANTLRQTAFLKPKLKSRLPGLYFAGQLTTPGPGVPPSLISGEVAAAEAHAYLNAHPGAREPQPPLAG